MYQSLLLGSLFDVISFFGSWIVVANHFTLSVANSGPRKFLVHIFYRPEPIDLEAVWCISLPGLHAVVYKGMPTKTNHELREFNKQHIIIMMTKINVVKNNTDSTMYTHLSKPVPIYLLGIYP